jgi:hypothetical protein
MILPYTFVLIHSPLVGPFTWSPVAEHFVRRGIDAMVPVLSDEGDASAHYWQRHARSVARFIEQHPQDQPLILTAHSGSGPLLPAISAAVRAATGAQVAAYLFVDAGIPLDGHSRLDLMALESPQWAGEFREFLEAGGSFPNWTDEQLREIVPDAHSRQRLLAELCPRTLPFFTEPIAVFPGWPDAPCGYIRLSPAYNGARDEARRVGWVVAEMEVGHFHMLVNPSEVAEAMLGVVRRL